MVLSRLVFCIGLIGCGRCIIVRGWNEDGDGLIGSDNLIVRRLRTQGRKSRSRKRKGQYNISIKGSRPFGKGKGYGDGAEASSGIDDDETLQLLPMEDDDYPEDQPRYVCACEFLRSK